MMSGWSLYYDNLIARVCVMCSWRMISREGLDVVFIEFPAAYGRWRSSSAAVAEVHTSEEAEQDASA